MGKRTKPYPDAWRDHVDAKGIRDRLQNHVLKGTPMSATQIQASKILLAKVVPDMKAIEHTGNVKTETTVTRVELVPGVVRTDSDPA